MRSQTHENIAKMLFPEYTFRKIQQVNSILDNPTRQAKAFSDAMTMFVPNKQGGKTQYYNPYDVFHLGEKTQHRRVGHDPLQASIMVAEQAGIKSVPLANLHLMLDAISDTMKKYYGRSYRDLWEANLNYAIESYVRKRRNRLF